MGVEHASEGDSAGNRNAKRKTKKFQEETGRHGDGNCNCCNVLLNSTRFIRRILKLGSQIYKPLDG